ncbi:putative ubiquitin-transferase domain containing protein [Neospora caninum Liverpool]|nr:putative ubiquitin-transferase domain containing protein [Neospora caninum Liverpool]CBZ50106.1 putative ubiquitin-transferase domain containing protein [Neospora caninum Liverpool]|eukprot:XP_003880141.1 putative ubiquitin-transferase domain containing protein [Neospora caninum Liverpool]
MDATRGACDGPRPEASPPPLDGPKGSEAFSASPSFVSRFASQNAQLVSFPSLQRQQTEQLVKALDFHVYLWGLNDKGQLLNGAFGLAASPETPKSTGEKDPENEGGDEKASAGEEASATPATGGPSRVKKLQHKTIAGMSCSGANTFIWDFHDLLWAGGSTEIGLELLGMDLDDDGRGDGVVPRASLCETLGDVKMVASSNTHAVAVLENGAAISFGSNEFGQLGQGPASVQLGVSRPRLMLLHPDSARATQGQVSFTTATCGENFSVLLSATGVVFACGDGSHGCLGLGARASSSSASLASQSSTDAPSPASLALLSPLYAVPIRQVAAGAQHVVALTISGAVYTWGRNKDGRLGLGDAYAHARVVTVPTRVEHLGRLGRRVKFVAAGYSHSAVLLTGGRVMTCGSNYYGELGREPYYEVEADQGGKLKRSEDFFLFSSTFLPVVALANHRVKLISLGQHFSAAVTASGKLFCWGRNDLRQLGVPCSSPMLRLSPSAAEVTPALKSDPGKKAGDAHEQVPPAGGGSDAGHSQNPAAEREALADERQTQPESAQDALALLHPSLPYASTPLLLQVENPDLFFYFVACGDFHCGAAAVPASVAAVGQRSRGRDDLRPSSSAVADLQPFFKSIFCRSQSLIGCEFPRHSISRGLSSLGPGSCLAQGSFTRNASWLQNQTPGLDVERHLSSSASLAGSFEESAVASSSYLAGVSVEEFLMLIEGSQSTGDAGLLKSKLALVFADVYRLNSSFVFPGRGCHPDFAGLDEVYVHLPEDMLPVLATSVMTCLAGCVKYAQHFKSADAIRFILFILACFRLYGWGIEDMAIDAADLNTPSQGEDGPAREPSFVLSSASLSEAAEAARREARDGESDGKREGETEGREGEQTESERHEKDDKHPDTQKTVSGVNDARGEAIFAALAHLLFHLPPEGKMEFVRLAAEFPDNLFERRLVRMTKWFITKTLRQAPAAYRNVDRLWHGVALLELLYLANMRPCSHRAYLLPSSPRLSATSETADNASKPRKHVSSSLFAAGERDVPTKVKIPVEKFHLAAVGQLVDPIREVALYADLIQRARGASAESGGRRTPQDSEEAQGARGSASENACGGREERGEGEDSQERREETEERKNEKETQDTPTLPQRRKRETWSTFDVYQDVVFSTELQSRWCFFMAHMHLCPLEFKRNVILVDNIYKQHHTGLQSLLEAQLPFLLLRVHRGALLDDAVEALQKANPRQLLRPLKIVFEGEEGVDEGGLKREFFSLLTPELLSPERGLFTYNPAARTYWFSNLSPEDVTAKEKYYWLIGALASMAIYNDMIMPLAFPLVLYNMLQGRRVTLEDLGDVFPEEMNSFEKMLTMDKRDEFEAAFSTQTFAVDLVRDGKVVGEASLMEGGESIPVTMENRGLFVSKYTHYLLVDSVKQQYDAFERGFLLCSSPLVSQLSGRELQLLICGTPELDFRQLRESAKLEGFEADDPYIESFWKIVLSFDIFQKQKFLKFVTGSDRSPAFGLKEIRMTLQKNGGEPTERLPTAYTCFNVLLLPRYASSEKLQLLLLRAIDESEGFGLQ